MQEEKVLEFIMLPTVDFCFQELMNNPKVRKGFVAAVMRMEPEQIQETFLIPTLLSRDSENDKLGILDVRIVLLDGTQLNLEMQVRYFEYWNDKTGELYSDKLEIQILELKKLPKEVQTGDNLIAWMKFFSGKSREDFEGMKGKNEYIDEACDTLMRLSADDKKRLEYEAREKALRDYNSQMSSAKRQGEREGEERGIAIGEERAEKRTKRIFKLNAQGKSVEEIAALCGVSVEKVQSILE